MEYVFPNTVICSNKLRYQISDTVELAGKVFSVRMGDGNTSVTFENPLDSAEIDVLNLVLSNHNPDRTFFKPNFRRISRNLSTGVLVSVEWFQDKDQTGLLNLSERHTYGPDSVVTVERFYSDGEIRERYSEAPTTEQSGSLDTVTIREDSN